MLITIIAFIVILSILVLVHELGHFILAKRFGIKVEEFGFGFPPRIFGKKVGETIYSVNLLPIGGFVKLYGEDEAGGGTLQIKNQKSKIKNVGKAFFARPAWQRASIVFAGVVMNFILAIVLISYLFSVHGVAIPTNTVTILETAPKSPAAQAGIKKGDKVISVDNRMITKPEEFSAIVKKNAGKPVELQLKRNGEELKITITPRKTYPKGEGPLGVAISNVEVKKYPWYQAPFYGTLEAGKFSLLIIQGLFDMVANLILKGAGPVGVAGPIGVAQLTGQAVSYGLVATLWFVALLSLNLAVVNVLPIPALDGGRLFFILIELVTGRKIDPKREALAHAIGLAVLLALILLITFFDVTRLLSGKSLIPQM